MSRRAVLCSVWLAPLVGCNLIRTSTHNVTNEYRVDHGDEVIVKRMRRDADDVLREICQRHPKRAFTKEFREGFKDGYVDYLDSGGPVRPPVAPTARFRGPKYLSPEGHCLMRDYILGFEYGGNVAQSTGRRQFFMVPMLISEEPKPPALNITVLPNPPEGLSDEKDKPKEKIPDTRPLSPSTQPPAGPGPTGTPTPSTAPTSPTPTTPMSTTPSPITPAPMTPSPAPMTPTPAPKSSAISTMPAAALPATPMPIPMTPAAAAPMPELPKVVIPAVEVPAPVVVPKVMPLPLPQPTPLPTPTPSTKPMPTPAAPANPPTTTALPGSIAVPAVSSWRPWPTRPSVNTQPNTDIIPVSGTAPADAPRSSP